VSLTWLVHIIVNVSTLTWAHVALVKTSVFMGNGFLSFYPGIVLISRSGKELVV
jgi:hypothetical protein